MENTYQTFFRFKFSLNQLFQRVFFHNFAVGKTIGSPMLWLPACARARHCIVVLYPKVGKCNQTNDTYTFKQSKILQISLQLR